MDSQSPLQSLVILRSLAAVYTLYCSPNFYVSRRNARRNEMHVYAQHCVTCRSCLNAPASIEAVCDLLEEVVKLDPSLIQVRVCFYALSIVLHHCVWHLKALVQISFLNGMDAHLCKPTL